MINSVLLRALVVGFLASLHLLSPTAPRAESAAQAIEQRLRGWTTDFNAGRVGKLCDLFAPDLIANYRGQPEKSFDSLCDALPTHLSGGQRDFHYDLELQAALFSVALAPVPMCCRRRS